MTRKATIIISLLLIISTSLNIAEARPRVGLVLGGGGARGGAHVGVLKVLERENIPIDYIVGTSVGSLVGSLYAGGLSSSELEEFALSGKIKKLYKTKLPIFRLMMLPLTRQFYKLRKKQYYAGFYGDFRLKDYINNAIIEKQGSLKTEIPFQAVAVDLISGKRTVLEIEDIGLSVQASTAIPGLRKPVKYQDKLLMDGGLIDNIPVEQACEQNADIIIVVDVDPSKELQSPKDFANYEEVLTRAFNLDLIAQSARKLEWANIVISPEVSGIRVQDFDKKILSNAIQEGELAATAKIAEIKELLKSRE